MLRVAALAALATLAACPRPAPKVEPPRAPSRAEAVVVGDVDVVAVDDDTTCWAEGATLWCRPVGGEARTLGVAAAPIAAIAIVDGAVYAATTDELVAVATPGAPLRSIARVPRWRAIAFARGRAWLGTDAALVAVDLRTGARRELVSLPAPAIAVARVGARTAIALATGEVLAVTDGGAVRLLAQVATAPTTLIALGGQACWLADDAVRCADVATGRGRRPVRGRIRALTSHRGRLAMIAGAALAMQAGERVLIAPAAASGTIVDGPLAASADALVVRLRDRDGAARLWRVPWPDAGPRPARVIAAIDGEVHALAVDGARLLIARAPAGGGPHELIAIDRGSGRARWLASVGWAGALAADRGVIALADVSAATIALLDGDRPRGTVPASARVDGLTVAGPELWWSDGWRLWRQRGDGRPTIAHEPVAIAGADVFAPAAVVVVDGRAYYASLGRPGDGVYRAGPGEQRATLYERRDQRAVADLVRVGDALFATVGDADLVRVPLVDGAARIIPGAPRTTVLRLFGGPALAALTLTDDGLRLVTLDRATGAARAAWPIPGELAGPPPVADDDAVFGFLDDTGWLIAIPR